MNVTAGLNPDVTNASTPEQAGGSLDNSAKSAAFVVENSVEKARQAVNSSYVHKNVTPQNTLLYTEAHEARSVVEQEPESLHPAPETPSDPELPQQVLPPQYGSPRVEDPVYAEKRSLEAVNNFEDWYAAALGMYRQDEITRTIR